MGYALRGRVGAGGDNFPDDIVVVQVLLNLVPENKSGASPRILSVGQDTPQLRSAIVTFQTRNTPYRDGRIDPGGLTWRTLLKMAQEALGANPLPPLPVPPPQPQPQSANLLRKLDTPVWGDWGWKDLPLLANPPAVRSAWPLQFGGAAKRPMNTYAFATPPGSHVKYIGVASPADCPAPKAYLIYFRHTATPTDYPNEQTMVEKGLGDYLTGRMQIAPQISASGRDVAAVVPMAIGGLGEFESKESFISQCLVEIDSFLTNAERQLPPLLLACYSDGIGKMAEFFKNCPRLRDRVRAVYDFDGMLVSRFRGITLSSIKGAQVTRYVGTTLPARRPKETDEQYLNRNMAAYPSIVPLPRSRWKSYNVNAVLDDMWWLHYFIPSCMLQHGLTMTTGLA